MQVIKRTLSTTPRPDYGSPEWAAGYARAQRYRLFKCWRNGNMAGVPVKTDMPRSTYRIRRTDMLWDKVREVEKGITVLKFTDRRPKRGFMFFCMPHLKYAIARDKQDLFSQPRHAKLVPQNGRRFELALKSKAGTQLRRHWKIEQRLGASARRKNVLSLGACAS